MYNGREAEVIVNFADGLSYSKSKMEDAVRAVVLERHPAKPAKESTGVKREDVDIIINEFEIPRAQAERALAEHGGDLSETLRALIAS